jgi:hypothetical protein
MSRARVSRQDMCAGFSRYKDVFNLTRKGAFDMYTVDFATKLEMQMRDGKLLVELDPEWHPRNYTAYAPILESTKTKGHKDQSSNYYSVFGKQGSTSQASNQEKITSFWRMLTEQAFPSAWNRSLFIILHQAHKSPMPTHIVALDSGR